MTIVLNLFDGKITGWSLSEDMTARNTTIKAWRMAVKNRPPAENLLFRPGRGIQYACSDFTKLLDSYKNTEQSRSRKRNYWKDELASDGAIFFSNH